jgi:hypothetical protein
MKSVFIGRCKNEFEALDKGCSLRYPIWTNTEVCRFCLGKLPVENLHNLLTSCVVLWVRRTVEWNREAVKHWLIVAKRVRYPLYEQ